MDGVLDLERDFYHQGFAGGLPHGHLHGLIEGRELGRDHAWTLWDEIGYYQGMALLWKHILTTTTNGTTAAPTRAHTTLDQLLALVVAFPTHNDSTHLDGASDGSGGGGVDMTAQLSALRTKYRTACAALGVRPRMAVSSSSSSSSAASSGDQPEPATDGDTLKRMGLSV